MILTTLSWGDDLMRVYHFCAAKSMRAILRQGVKVGGVYVPHPGDAKSIDMYRGYQWVTLDPERANQSWATRQIVKYDRTAYRMAIDLPDEAVERLLTRDQLDAEIPGSGVLFDGWPGSESWRVYHGWILPEWITECDRVDGGDAA